jgi:tyrosine phenol-lyase
MPLERRSWAEPFKIKMVEPLRMTTREQREQALKEAGYNTFLLKSRDVYIDLLTDSGTSAMSDRQWAGLMLGDEAYAGSENFYHLESAVRRYYGYRHVIPAHQGRGAEHILSRVLIRAGDVIPGNMYFTTTRLHQELCGGTFADVIIAEAHDPENEHPFKGDVDPEKLERVLKENPGRVPYISVAATVNMAGGQPISLANLREVRALADRYGTRVILDATRVAENAWFIQQREPGQSHRSVAEIVRELCSLTDGCTMSAKKDPLANIGGFLAVNDDRIAEEARNLVVVYEGLHTYGGMAGRDMEAVAIGIEESVQRASGRCCISARNCAAGAFPSCFPWAATASFSMRAGSCRTCRRSTTRRRRWPRRSTSTAACAPWSAASSAPAATRRPAKSASRGSSWCGSPSRAAFTRRRTWT